jgi:hypothetical protein
MEVSPVGPSCELPQQGGVKAPETCGNAMSDRVGRLEITSKGAQAVCNTDTVRETVPPTVAPLGIVTRAGGMTCVVAPIGLTCVEEARGAAFFLTQGRYAVLNR